jgi:hypothetical protein
MSRPAKVFGLFVVGAVFVAAMVFLWGRVSEPLGAVPGGSAVSGGTLDVPCSSCDIRHQRLGKNRSSKD